MSSTPDDLNREARTRIADAIVTAAERGRTLTLEDLEAEGQPVGTLGPDREAQARVVMAWTTLAAERVAEARAALAADKRRPVCPRSDHPALGRGPAVREDRHETTRCARSTGLKAAPGHVDR